MTCIHKHTQTFPFVPGRDQPGQDRSFKWLWRANYVLGTRLGFWKASPVGLAGKGCLLWLLPDLGKHQGKRQRTELAQVKLISCPAPARPPPPRSSQGGELNVLQMINYRVISYLDSSETEATHPSTPYHSPTPTSLSPTPTLPKIGDNSLYQVNLSHSIVASTKCIANQRL